MDHDQGPDIDDECVLPALSTAQQRPHPLSDLRRLDRIFPQRDIRLLGINDPNQSRMPPRQGFDPGTVAIGQNDVLPLFDVNSLELPRAGHDADLGFDEQVFGWAGQGPEPVDHLLAEVGKVVERAQPA